MERSDRRADAGPAHHYSPTSMSGSSRPGGKSAPLVFVLVLAAYVVESQLTQVRSARETSSDVHNLIPRQYVQTTLKYRHPYFLMYVS